MGGKYKNERGTPSESVHHDPVHYNGTSFAFAAYTPKT